MYKFVKNFPTLLWRSIKAVAALGLLLYFLKTVSGPFGDAVVETCIDSVVECLPSRFRAKVLGYQYKKAEEEHRKAVAELKHVDQRLASVAASRKQCQAKCAALGREIEQLGTPDQTVTVNKVTYTRRQLANEHDCLRAEDRSLQETETKMQGLRGELQERVRKDADRLHALEVRLLRLRAGVAAAPEDSGNRSLAAAEELANRFDPPAADGLPPGVHSPVADALLKGRP